MTNDPNDHMNRFKKMYKNVFINKRNRMYENKK